MCTTKWCNACHKSVKLSDFGVNNRYKDKLNIYCKKCIRLARQAYRKTTRGKDVTNRATKKHAAKHLEYSLQWAKDNAAHCAAKSKARRAGKGKATPIWSDLTKCKLYYENARLLSRTFGVPFEVDHIVPLQGKNVCGLHIHNNLQILTQSNNRAKGNTHVCSIN